MGHEYALVAYISNTSQH